MQGINIYSGAGGLGSALTNSTELAYRKGVLKGRTGISVLRFTYDFKPPRQLRWGVFFMSNKEK